MSLKSIWALLKSAASSWSNNNAYVLGAALAYYTVFALAPLLVIAIAVAGAVFGHEAAQRHVSDQVQQLVGHEGGKAVQTMIKSADQPGQGIVGSVLGVIMLLFGAGALFGQLQTALNTVWGVEPRGGRGIWGIIRDRFLSFTMVLGCAFLLLVSLLVSAALDAVMSLLGDWQAGLVGHAVDLAVSLLVITLLFAMIYRFLPDVKIAWRDVWLGAVVTTVLFLVGKFLIGLYLGGAAVGSTYGAAGSLAVLLVWLYYSALIFLFGAELTKAYADHFGSRIVPDENAVAVTKEAQERQAPAGKGHGKAAADARPGQAATTPSRA